MNTTIKHMREAKSSANCTSWGNKIVSVVLSAILLGFGWPAVNPAEVYAEDGAANGGGGAPSFLTTLQTLRRRRAGGSTPRPAGAPKAKECRLRRSPERKTKMQAIAATQTSLQPLTMNPARLLILPPPRTPRLHSPSLSPVPTPSRSSLRCS